MAATTNIWVNRGQGLIAVRDALRLMLVVIQFNAMGKDDFINAMGGPTVPVGTGSATVQDLADCLEVLITHLTTPGSRVFRRAKNQDFFWTKLTETIQ